MKIKLNKVLTDENEYFLIDGNERCNSVWKHTVMLYSVHTYVVIYYACSMDCYWTTFKL